MARPDPRKGHQKGLSPHRQTPPTTMPMADQTDPPPRAGYLLRMVLAEWVAQAGHCYGCWGPRGHSLPCAHPHASVCRTAPSRLTLKTDSGQAVCFQGKEGASREGGS